MKSLVKEMKKKKKNFNGLSGKLNRGEGKKKSLNSKLCQRKLPKLK